MRRKLLILSIGWAMAWLVSVSAAGTLAQEESPMSVQVYPVADLLAAEALPRYRSEQWPGTGMFGDASGEQSYGTMRGGIGGGGGMGGGAGAGGLFAVPSAGAQGFGQGQAGGGGMGGGGMGGSGMPGRMGSGSPRVLDVASEAGELCELIQGIVSQQSWEPYGGAGVCNCYNGKLVINQTDQNHQQISELLAELRRAQAQTQVIQLEWVAIRGQADVNPPNHQMTAEQINQLIQGSWVQRGGVSTLNGRLAYTTAAEHRNLVIGVTPVVGAGGLRTQEFNNDRDVGYQPKTVKAALGWLVEMRPLVPPGDNVPARIQVGASYTEGPQAASMPGWGQVDPGNLENFQVAGLVQAPAGQWALVGGMAQTANEADGDPSLRRPQYFVFVRWNPIDTAEVVEAEAP